MNPDEQLIDDAVEALDVLPEPKRRRLSWNLTALIKAYREACELASGPDPGRSKHWREMAGQYASRIRSFMVDNGFAKEIGVNRCVGKC
jgi:hypothetical protein